MKRQWILKSLPLAMLLSISTDAQASESVCTMLYNGLYHMVYKDSYDAAEDDAFYAEALFWMAPSYVQAKRFHEVNNGTGFQGYQRLLNPYYGDYLDGEVTFNIFGTDWNEEWYPPLGEMTYDEAALDYCDPFNVTWEGNDPWG
jgi:hypothetical protein